MNKRSRTGRVAHGVLAMLTLMGAATLNAATINVSGGGSALQTAISNASAGDILLVAPGTYSPINSDNKAITIESTHGASVTFIDGGGINRCATLGSAEGHNNTILIGFTLKNGHTYINGGGSSGGTLNNCTLTGNTVTYAGGGACYGILNNCTLTGNGVTGSDGGGGGACYSTLNICTLSGNTADCGGGVCFSTLNNCTLSKNTAKYGGGAYESALNNCTLKNNSANKNGGGAYNSTLRYCTLTSNLAGYDGGGAYYGVLEDCLLESNSADAGGGGACYSTLNNCKSWWNWAGNVGGGVYGSTLNNCLLFGNSAKRGGGTSTSTLYNCTVAGNAATDYSGFILTLRSKQGGGAHKCTIRNSIFYRNYGKTTWGFWTENDLLDCPDTEYSRADNPPVNKHNIYSDPDLNGSVYVDDYWDVIRVSGDFRLASNSPCKDKGNNTYVTWDFDLDGYARIHNGTVDMGCYEYAPTFYVTFRSNGGNSDWQDVKQRNSTPYILPATNPASSGYTFAGWFTAASGGTQVTTNTVVTQTTAHTLYAHWTPNTYTVTYNGNGADGGSTANSYHTYGIASPLMLNGFFRTGYTFAGWTNSVGTTTYSNGANVSNLSSTPNGTVTLHAKWTPITYTVAYNGNGNTGGSMSSTSHTYGTPANLRPNGFTKTGHTFAGWAETASDAVVFTNGESVLNLTSTQGAVVTNFAKWTPNTYTVTYDGNGADGGSTEDSSHIYGVASPLTLNGFTRTGYTFTGWATTSGGAVVYTNGQEVSTLTSTLDGTYKLYAKWAAITYMVSYSSEGHTSGSMTPSSHTYGTVKMLSMCVFRWTGYEFAGWAESLNGPVKYLSGASVLNLTTVQGDTVPLYAVWRAVNYTVSYNGNGNTGGSTASSSHTYDTPSPLTLNGFVRTGYVFTGWARNAESPAMYADGQQISTLTPVPTQGGTVWLYAKWAGTANPELLDYPVWLGYYGLADTPENYDKWLAGLDPTDPNVAFRARIEMRDGKPYVDWTPDLGGLRSYTKEMKEHLSDPWQPAPEDLSTLPLTPSRFFRVRVGMP
ncbi:MAG: InlB B-repeat-containing protein [Kiritimatiellaeota bacterium]|nr:InlB B-repeat-containing protein [Kiritimatiellota bacterium]